jgi:transposase
MSSPASTGDYAALDHAELVDRLTHLEAQFDQETTRLRERNAMLEERVRWFEQQVFGRSSERGTGEEINPHQRLLFNEAEALADTEPVADEPHVEIPAHTRKKRGRKKLPADLPRVDVIHDLPEAERFCHHDGQPLHCIGEEVSEQLDYIPARVRVLRHIRRKYACPGCDGCLKLAARPAQMLPKSNASPALLAHIVTAKYVDGLPLHRQQKQFARLGIDLGRASMANWMIKLGQGVVPLINLLDERIRAGPLIHCDETPVQVLNSAGGDRHWMWVRAGGPPGEPTVLFDHDPSRGTAVPKRLLADFSGILLTDGYEPYDAAVRAGSLTHAGCWAHVRRYFNDAQRSGGGKTDGHAARVLEDIKALYRIERALRQGQADDAEILATRAEHSRPIVDDLKARLEALAPEVVPKSLLGKAVHYALGQWPKLVRFLDHAVIPLDNNRAENAIRPFVMGRKAWLFAATPNGAVASARLYSLVETAKANGIEPHAYLTHLFNELPKATTVEEVEALLPWNAKAVISNPA